MYSGKTTELMRRLRRYSHAKKAVVVVKFSGDTRYTDQDEISSHDRVTMRAIPACLLSSIPAHLVNGCDVIGIDEGQFFPDLIDFVEAALAANKTVIVSALDGDFRRKPFGRVLELVPMAERVDKLSAVCTGCSRDAAFTKRTVASTQLQLIGGAESYQPVCRDCFLSVPGADASLAGPAEAKPAALLSSPATVFSKTQSFTFGSPLAGMSDGITSPSSSGVSSGGSPSSIVGDPSPAGLLLSPGSAASVGAFLPDAMAIMSE